MLNSLAIFNRRGPRPARARRATSPGRAREAVPPPPLAFLKGALLGFILVTPAQALAVWTLGRFGVVGSGGYVHVLELAAVFAGLPAIMTAGGVARLAARRRIATGGDWKSSLRTGALGLSAGGALLALLVALPLGPPTGAAAMILTLTAGAFTGAATGAAVGLAASYGAPEEVSS